MFSSHTGAPTDGPLLDTDPKLYDIQKGQRGIAPILDQVGSPSFSEFGERMGLTNGPGGTNELHGY